MITYTYSSTMAFLTWQFLVCWVAWFARGPTGPTSRLHDPYGTTLNWLAQICQQWVLTNRLQNFNWKWHITKCFRRSASPGTAKYNRNCPRGKWWLDKGVSPEFMKPQRPSFWWGWDRGGSRVLSQPPRIVEHFIVFVWGGGRLVLSATP